LEGPEGRKKKKRKGMVTTKGAGPFGLATWRGINGGGDRVQNLDSFTKICRRGKGDRAVKGIPYSTRKKKDWSG